MHKIRYFLILMSFSLSAAYGATCVSFSEGKKEYFLTASKEMKDKNIHYAITIKGDKTLTQDYSCFQDKKLTLCMGDDDSGSFSINEDTQVMVVKHLTLGEPDDEMMNFNWTSAPRTFNLKPCKN